MGKRSIFVLLGLLVAAGVFADVYTWTDESGVVHYSDRQNPGAKRVILPESTTSTRPAATRRSAPTSVADADRPPPFSYESVEIASPTAEETLWNIGGTLGVSVALLPSLRSGDKVRVFFDGTPQEVAGTSFQLQEVHRGVHNLQVEILDAAGNLMIRSQPSRFYVQQNTVIQNRAR